MRGTTMTIPGVTQKRRQQLDPWAARCCVWLVGVYVALLVSAPCRAASMLDRTGRFSIQWWTGEDGLTDSWLTGVALAADGSVFCCSRDRLMRFDGQTFEPIPNHLTKPLHDAIGNFWSLGFDGEGRLWVQGGQAIARLRSVADPQRPAAWTIHSLPTGKVFSMSFGPNGRPVLVGPDMIAAFDGSRLIQFRPGTADEENVAWRYGGVSPATGEAWLWGTKPNPRRLFHGRIPEDGSALPEIAEDPTSIANALISIGFGPSGAWALLPDCIAVHRNDGWERLPPELPDALYRISGKIVESSDGTVWISDHTGLLACRDGRIETVIEGVPGFSSFTTHLVADESGGVWAACAGGLLAVRRAAVHVRSIEECRAVYVRRDGSMLVGSPGSVTEYAPASDAPAEPAPQARIVAMLPKNAVPTALLETPDGRIWVGTQNSYILRIENGVVRQITKPERHYRELRSIHALATDAAGRVWAGTANGLAVHDRATDEFCTLSSQETPLTSFVIGLASEADGGMLSATITRGVERIAPDGSATPLLPAAELPSRRSLVFHRDTRGTLWIGGDHGLVGIYPTGAKIRHASATGLVDDAVRQIEEGTDGRLWVATRDGRVQGMQLDSLEKLATRQSQVVRGIVLGPLDGLGDDECVGRIAYESNHSAGDGPPRDVRDRIVVPLTHGIAAFDPLRLPLEPRSATPPSVVRDRVASWGFVFSSAGIQWGDSPLYQTFLRGVDTAWSAPSPTTRRDYGALRPGRHVFEARIVSGETDADFPAAGLEFSVPTPLWLRPGIWAAAAAILSGLTFVVAREATRRRTQRDVEQLERQAEMDRERSRIARDIHDSLGAGLTQVALMSDFARRGPLPPQDVRDRFETIYGRARGLARSVDEIVWAVNPKNDTVGQFIAYVVNDVEDFARAGDLVLRLHLPEGPCAAIPLQTQTRHHLCLAIRELVQNVLRHARASRIDLTIDMLPNSLLIVVSDDGIGFPPGQCVGPDQDGLANIRSRLAELAGEVLIDSSPGAGTRVRLRVPLHERPTLLASGVPQENRQ
jgi:signal transduction histidine kinase/streptogramin lyase